MACAALLYSDMGTLNRGIELSSASCEIGALPHPWANLCCDTPMTASCPTTRPALSHWKEVPREGRAKTTAPEHVQCRGVVWGSSCRRNCQQVWLKREPLTSCEHAFQSAKLRLFSSSQRKCSQHPGGAAPRGFELWVEEGMLRWKATFPLLRSPCLWLGLSLTYGRKSWMCGPQSLAYKVHSTHSAAAPPSEEEWNQWSLVGWAHFRPHQKQQSSLWRATLEPSISCFTSSRPRCHFLYPV